MRPEARDDGDALNEARLEAVEHRLTTALAAWSGASLVAGATLVAVGQATGRRELAAFGRQTAAWGAVDGLIAAVGAVTRRRRGALTTDQRAARAGTLRTVLWVNALADVGYVVGGGVIVLRDARGRPLFGMRRGDGIAVVTQGAFLLALDLTQAQQLGVRR